MAGQEPPAGLPGELPATAALAAQLPATALAAQLPATAGLAATAGLLGELPECMGVNPMHSPTAARGWVTRHGNYHPAPGSGSVLAAAAEPKLEHTQPDLWQQDP